MQNRIVGLNFFLVSMITIRSILRVPPTVFPGCSTLSFNFLSLKCYRKGHSDVLFTEAQGHHLVYL